MSWLITPQLTTVEGIPWDQIPASLRWTPANMSTALWYDASDAATITTVGGAVSQWNDKSGSSRNATQGAEASRPLLVQAAVNGRSAIDFDGSNDFMSSSLTAAGLFSNAFCFVALFQRRRSGNSDAVPVNRRITNIASPFDGFSSTRRIGTGSAQTSLTSVSWTNISSLPNSPTLFSFCATPSTAYEHLNGTLVGQQSTVGISFSDPGGATNLGGTSNVNFGGYLCETVVVSALLSDGDREKLEGYLAHKWGVTSTLPSNHPYKNAAPTI